MNPSALSVNSGNIISLECQTDYCNPPANISWYIGDNKVSGHKNVTIESNSSGLSRTTSVHQYTAVPTDHGKPIFCTTTNIEGHIIVSRKNMLNIRSEYFTLIQMLIFFTLQNSEHKYFR